MQGSLLKIATHGIRKVRDAKDWDQSTFTDGKFARWNATSGKFEGAVVGGDSGLTVGDAITSGTANLILYEDSGNLLAESSNLTYDGTMFGLSSTYTSGGTDDRPLDISSTLNDSGAAGGSDVFRLIKGVVTQTDITGWDNVYLVDLMVGTNSLFRVKSVANAATGLVVTSAAAGSGVTLSVQSTGANENLSITPKGTGAVLLPAGNSSTPPLKFGSTVVHFYGTGPGGGLAISAAGTEPTSVYFGNYVNAIALSASRQLTWSSGDASGAPPDTGLKRNAAGVVEVTDGAVGFGSIRAWGLNNTFSSGEVRIDADGNGGTIRGRGSGVREYMSMYSALDASWVRVSKQAAWIGGIAYTSGGTDDKRIDISATLNDSGAAGGSDVFRLIKGVVTQTDITGWDNVYLVDLMVGTNSLFRVKSVANAATGLVVTSAAEGSGVTLAVQSTGANEDLTLTPKGTGALRLGSGAVDNHLILPQINNAGTPTLSFGGTEGVYSQGSGVLNFAVAGVAFTIWTAGVFDIGAAELRMGATLNVGDVGLKRNAAGVLKVTDGSSGLGDVTAGKATFTADAANSNIFSNSAASSSLAIDLISGGYPRLMATAGGSLRLGIGSGEAINIASATLVQPGGTTNTVALGALGQRWQHGFASRWYVTEGTKDKAYIEIGGAYTAQLVFHTNTDFHFRDDNNNDSLIQYCNPNADSAAAAMVRYASRTQNDTDGIQTAFKWNANFSSQTGTAGWTAFIFDATDGAGSGAKNIVDFQVGGSSRFTVDSLGQVSCQDITGTTATDFFVAAGAGKTLYLGANGANGFFTNGSILAGANATGPALMNEAPSATNPTLCPDRSETDRGIGGTTGTVSIITGGVEAIKVGASQAITVVGNIRGNQGHSYTLANTNAQPTVPTVCPRADTSSGIGANNALPSLSLISGNFSFIFIESFGAKSSGTHSPIIHDVKDLTITGAVDAFYCHKFTAADVTAATPQTITTAATVYIDTAPAAVGAGPATITSPYALLVGGGRTKFGGGLEVADTVHFGAIVANTISADAVTINLNDANQQTVDLAAATGAVTVTLDAGASQGASAGNIMILQDDTARDITWVAGANITTGYWLGTEPTWSSDTAQKRRIVSWLYDGTNIYLAVTSEETATF